MKTHYDIVVVGAGISGATIAERYANLLGKKVLVVEKRDHIGGNCYDYTNEHGIRVSKYGPHYFHTNDEGVWEYVSKFTEWQPYEHRVIAHVDGKKVPVPVNIQTVNTLFDLDMKSEEEMRGWLDAHTEKIADPKNSEEAALRRVGPDLYEKLFKGYTAKQWDMEPKELGPEVTDRIPVRTTTDDRYFTDTHQALPKEGYARIFQKMLSNSNITIMLNADWDSLKADISWDALFFTGRIDSYFAEKFGKLEYRSLRFEFETLDQEFFQDKAQENYPDRSIPFTRIVEFKRATGEAHPSKTTISREFPTWEGEPYYPVPSEKNRELYKSYQQEASLAEKDSVYFVGRLANYKYFNMDQAFRNALDLFYRLNPEML